MYSIFGDCMRKNACLKFLITLVCASFLIACQSLETPTQVDENYTQGSWVGRRFMSEWFGFRYSPTSDIVLNSEQAIKTYNARQSVVLDGANAEQVDYSKMQVAYEVIGESTDGITTIEILSEKINEENFSEQMYIERLRLELTETHGRDITFFEEEKRKLGNTEYLELSCEIRFLTFTRYQTFLLKRKGDRMATIVVYYASPEILNRVLRSFSNFS